MTTETPTTETLSETLAKAVKGNLDNFKGIEYGETLSITKQQILEQAITMKDIDEGKYLAHNYEMVKAIVQSLNTIGRCDTTFIGAILLLSGANSVREALVEEGVDREELAKIKEEYKLMEL